MSILDQNYDPEKGKYNVRLPEQQPGTNSMMQDAVNHLSFASASPNGLLFSSYVILHYNDKNHSAEDLIKFLDEIVSSRISSGDYYKFVHLYNCASSRYEDVILSSASCDIDSFAKKDFEKLDDFMNSIGSMFDCLVKYILESESD